MARRALALREAILPGRSVGYDVMVFVGIQRFLHHRQRLEIQESLSRDHGISLSTGTISALTILFGEYLGALHRARAGALRAVLERDGGWPMHVDCTGENGRGTMLVAYTSWRRWVLGAWKIPTESTDAILPRMKDVVRLFGPPCAVVRDLGRAVIPASAGLVATLDHPIPILACHAHFLADIGKDLLEPSHDALRKLFRCHDVRPELRDQAREIGRRVGTEMSAVRDFIQTWMNRPQDGHTLPEDPMKGIGVVRALAQWVLDYPADSIGTDFPFATPYLDLYDRCILVRRAVDAFLRHPPENKDVARALDRLARTLDPVSQEIAFAQAARTLRRRAGLFEELRAALRLHHPTTDDASNPPPPEDLQDIQASVEKLTVSLQERRPKRGPAEDARRAIDLILKHLKRHGAFLWGHAVDLPPELGGGVRLVDRTNNDLEGLHRGIKQGERRRSGHKTLSDDMENLPAEAALARNLLCPDYVEILCGSLDKLPLAFANLDGQKNQLAHAASARRSTKESLASDGGSLPKQDRRIARSDSTTNRILSAARSRAPRTATAPVGDRKVA